MQAWNQISAGLLEAVGAWQRVPADFWGVLWPLALMTFSAYPMVLGLRTLRDNITSRLDRWLLALLFGMAYYTILFTVANALLAGSPCRALLMAYARMNSPALAGNTAFPMKPIIMAV